jgi:hypothetical protein
MAKNTIQKKLIGTDTWFGIFGVGYSVLTFVLPGFSKLMLLIFVLNLKWFDNPISKLTFAMFGVYSLMGFWVFFVKIHEYWENEFISLQRSKYGAKSPQKAMTVRVHIPESFEYDPNIFISFFFFMGNAFKTTNVTKQIMYNYGRWFSNVTFDQIIRNGHIETYMTFPQKKYNEVVEMYKRFFPILMIEPVEDPFKDWPKAWSDGANYLGYDRVVGFNLANSNSNTFPLCDATDLNPSNMPMDMLMRAIRDTFPDEIVVFQNVFRFNPGNWGGNKESEYHKEFEEWRMEILEQYAPKNGNKLDTHAFEAFLPQWAHKSLSKIAYHLNCMYPSYAYRVLALCHDANDELVFQKLEKLCRVYTGNTFDDGGNDVALMYLTATNQEYKKDKTAGNRKFQAIYDTFVFPDQFGDQFEAMISPLYETYYYPNENRYRRYNIYRTTLRRDINAPWNGDWNLTEAFGMSGFFQFPSQSSKSNPIESLVGAKLDLHKSVYIDSYDK